jgi:methylthioribose-1-phosphate isomerase
MNIDGKHYRTIWPHDDGASVEVIDQTLLPHEFATMRLAHLSDAVEAIRSMVVRGAPLIGVTAAYGLAIAMRFDASDDGLTQAYQALLETRPTAVNLRWALDEMRARIAPLSPSARPEAAWTRAAEIADEDVAISKRRFRSATH